MLTKMLIAETMTISTVRSEQDKLQRAEKRGEEFIDYADRLYGLGGNVLVNRFEDAAHGRFGRQSRDRFGEHEDRGYFALFFR